MADKDTNTTPLDPEEASIDFANRMDEVISHGYLSLSLAIGAQLGLFQVLKSFDRHATVAEIAEEAQCKERLVEEWLRNMAVVKVVEISDSGDTFLLPKAHHLGVSSPHMVESMSKFIPLLAQSHMPLLACFKKDGPTDMSNSGINFMLEEWEKDSPERMNATIPQVIEQIDGLQANLERGISVCEIGPSRGHLLEWMAKSYPKSFYTGVEICQETAAEANKRMETLGLKNVHIVVADAADMPEEMVGRFDYILMVDVFHDIPRASKAASEFYRCLKSGGSLSVVDTYCSENPKDNIDNPFMPILYPFSFYYCLGVSFSQSGSEGLGACAGNEKIIRLLEAPGFKVQSNVKKVFGDMAHFIAVKP